MTTHTARRPLLYRVPFLGRIAREVIEGDSDNIYYLAVTIATIWILAVAQWGLPALVLPMVGLAPICLLMLVLITLG